ncbi:MAG: hydantoinase B/oxoprolinase family protein [Nitrospinota bacterium]
MAHYHDISIVDESAAALSRAAFSRVVSEGHDFSCGLFDSRGRMIVQSLGIPGFLGCLALAMRAFLREHPPESLRPGDSLATNDPWVGPSQLHDITLITPIFYRGRIAAFAGNVSHSPDAGGRLLSGDCREVFEEGIRIPILKYFKRGKPNEELFKVIRMNVRVPDIVVGDIFAQQTANLVMKRRVVEFLRRAGLEDLDELGGAMIARSERAVREGIRLIPDGLYSSTVETDGFDEPLVIKACVRVEDEEVTVDFRGTSPQNDRGINSCYNFTFAETVFPFLCITNSTVPVNEGSFRPFTVRVPEGTVLNARPPAAIGARTMVSGFIQAAIFRALSPVVAERVLADSSAPTWVPTLSGLDQDGRGYVEMLFLSGGLGARSNMDGLDVISFPNNLSPVPVEILENEKPLLVLQKEFVPDSGGPGRYRGGCGQRVVLKSKSPTTVTLALRMDRLHHPAKGLFGGGDGLPGRVSLNGERELHGKLTYYLNHGDTVEMQTPGGGGYGRPEEREPSLVLKDVREGLVSSEHAFSEYKVIIKQGEEEIDEEATRRLREAPG